MYLILLPGNSSLHVLTDVCDILAKKAQQFLPPLVYYHVIKRTPHFGVRSALAVAQNFGGVRMTGRALHPHLQKINLKCENFGENNFKIFLSRIFPSM